MTPTDDNRQAVEGVNPYCSEGGKADQVKEMFDTIAPTYDRLNALMSFGQYRRWLKRAVKAVAADSPRRLLDVATGTGDVAIAIARAIEGVEIVGTDLSESMIEQGMRKVKEAGLEERITLEQGDCLDLKYDDESFDAVTVAYGVRNFEHLLEGLQQMYRVLKPGGSLTILELSVPYHRVYRPFYRFYTRYAIPAMGKMIARDKRAYAYLTESIMAVPSGEQMCELMERAGFVETSWHPMTMGVCTLYRGHKK